MSDECRENSPEHIVGCSKKMLQRYIREYFKGVLLRHNRENSEKFGREMSDESRGNSPEHIVEDSAKHFTEKHSRIFQGSFVKTQHRIFRKIWARNVLRISRKFAGTHR